MNYHNIVGKEDIKIYTKNLSNPYSITIQNIC